MDSAVAVDGAMDSHNPNISPNPLKCPPTPLHQLSPERMNQQRIPQSPSLHSYLAENDRPRTRDSFTSDVQTKVAFLNSLATTTSVHGSPTRPNKLNGAVLPSGAPGSHSTMNTDNALQRAVMGYEEAQASLATLNAELERTKEELMSRKKRERLLAQRVEDLLEELQVEKEKRVRDQESYTKEIKRCRKETYRAELAVVEARQDLQEARAEVKKSQSEVQHEKTEKEKSRQESFERAYALAGMVGDVEQLKDRLKAVEKERDAMILEAKANLGEQSTPVLDTADEVEVKAEPMDEEGGESFRPHEGNENVYKSTFTADATRSDGGKIQDPGTNLVSLFPAFELAQTSAARLADFDSIRMRLDYYDKQLDGSDITLEEEVEVLRQELSWARRKHAEDEDLIHFMHMQCQFKACPCRLAESSGDRFVHDHVYDTTHENHRTSKKRKISNEIEREQIVAQQSVEDGQEQPLIVQDHLSQDTPEPNHQTATESEAAILPPEPTSNIPSDATPDTSDLDEAAGVPLPAPEPIELDSTNATPQLTAQLEDITQVLIEPGTASKPFSFSTSTASNVGLRDRVPTLCPAESGPTSLETDLFDLSPPKQAPPKRPSTAMGILTVESPIRVVPESPRSVRSSHTESIRPTMAERNHTMNQSITTTTKVALKNSPPRSSLHRRAQSRPNLRSHSPLASSVMSHDDHQHSDPRARFAKETSASPAPSTVFPVTPLHKHSRSMYDLAQQAKIQAADNVGPQSPPQTIATSTTTTRVPLKGFAEADNLFGPANTHEYGHAHTENLNIDMTMDRRLRAINGGGSIDAHLEHHPSQPIALSASTMLANVPGTPISREAALAQIRARRDRARSVNLKKSLENSGRENAGAATTKTPSKGARPAVVNRAGAPFALAGKENVRRELSQASAPGRFAF